MGMPKPLGGAVEPYLVQHRLDHFFAGEGDQEAAFECGAMAIDGQHPLVVGGVEHGGPAERLAEG